MRGGLPGERMGRREDRGPGVQPLKDTTAPTATAPSCAPRAGGQKRGAKPRRCHEHRRHRRRRARATAAALRHDRGLPATCAWGGHVPATALRVLVPSFLPDSSSKQTSGWPRSPPEQLTIHVAERSQGSAGETPRAAELFFLRWNESCLSANGRNSYHTEEILLQFCCKYVRVHQFTLTERRRASDAHWSPRSRGAPDQALGCQAGRSKQWPPAVEESRPPSQRNGCCALRSPLWASPRPARPASRSTSVCVP